MISGFLNLYKPRGLSSAFAVHKIKKALKDKFYNIKVGHGGTLDILAEGVLPIAIGSTTKLTRFLLGAPKSYLFTVEFGKMTSTDDAEGEVIGTTAQMPTEEEISSICRKFYGTITQTPSIYSAIKIQGTRAYKLARMGQTPIMPTRQVTISSLKCIYYNNLRATMLVECSSGTYVRTLARDIGISLHSMCFVVELIRLMAGKFHVSESIDLEAAQKDVVSSLILPAAVL